MPPSFFKVLSSFSKSILSLTASATILGGAALLYMNQICENNRRVYLEALKTNALQDASRLTNESFGISWGFQADDTVMNTIDSGDLFFIKYECGECISLSDMLKCYRDTLLLLEEQYHTVGLAYRDHRGLGVYFNHFAKNRLINYSEFVSLPYLKELMLQKNPSHEIHQKLVKLLEQDSVPHPNDQYSEIDQNSQNEARSSPIETVAEQKANVPKYFLQELIGGQQQETFQFINRVLKKIEFISESENIVDIRELLRNQKQINIRTQTNNTLRSL